ncbi:MAG: hypothetical protein HDT18_05135 [Oscillibacter sp.]|nr:hypothetical protein [Oscillibacter sp.]
MALTYIKIFVDSLDAIEPLDDGERGRLFTALLRYARTGEVTGLQGNERILFPMLRAQLDRDAASYESICEANRINGAKGGRARAQAAASESSQDKEKDKDQYKEKKEKEYSFRGADRPAQRKYSTRNRSAPVRRDSPERVRKDLDWMDQFLLQLRREAAEREACEQAAADPEEDCGSGFY